MEGWDLVTWVLLSLCSRSPSLGSTLPPSVMLKVTSAFDYLLFYGQKRDLGAVIYPRTEQNQEPSCDLKYAVFLCPLNSGESLTLILEQEQYQRCWSPATPVSPPQAERPNPGPWLRAAMSTEAPVCLGPPPRVLPHLFHHRTPHYDTTLLAKT